MCVQRAGDVYSTQSRENQTESRTGRPGGTERETQRETEEGREKNLLEAQMFGFKSIDTSIHAPPAATMHLRCMSSHMMIGSAHAAAVNSVPHQAKLSPSTKNGFCDPTTAFTA